MVLHRRLAPGFSFAYVPWGPELPFAAEAAGSSVLGELSLAMKKLLPKDTVFIRFDPPEFTEGEKMPVARSAPSFFGKNFKRASADVQPPDSVFVDLMREPQNPALSAEDAILGEMKSKWRYNIGLAEKKGVEVRLSPPDSRGVPLDLQSFYRIYKETAGRDGISIHSMDYYAALFNKAWKYNAEPVEDGAKKPAVDVRLYLASHEKEDIAGIITLFRGSEAVYLYGASSNHKRNLMAPYALQWRAMRDAKAAHCLYYDLFGIPPCSPEEDPDHPMAGLYRFKTGFGGKIIHRAGSWDYIARPLLKTLYSAAEASRKKIWDLKKRIKRR
jgi:lipid II:glycine glycyltransferase (peptidoglycan interpeptide bridge formation enzyme)